MSSRARDRIPDVRDGLTRVERIVLHELHLAQREFGDRHVPSALLYGRVVEHVGISVAEFQAVLQRLAGKP
jgi:DNA gyrase/topoisomerase IV subunit A